MITREKAAYEAFSAKWPYKEIYVKAGWLIDKSTWQGEDFEVNKNHFAHSSLEKIQKEHDEIHRKIKQFDENMAMIRKEAEISRSKIGNKLKLIHVLWNKKLST